MSDSTDEYDHGRTEYATDPEPQGEVTFATPEDPDKPWRNANQLYYQYEILGKTQAEIADSFGCSDNTISKWMNRHDIDTRSPSEAGTEYPKLQGVDWLRTQHHTNGLSLREIAELVGCSKSAVEHAFNRHDIDTRPPSEANTEYPKLQGVDWLRTQHHTNELSQREIAELVGCSERAVRHAFNRHGIDARSKSEAHRIARDKQVRDSKSVSKAEVPDPPTGTESTERIRAGGDSPHSYEGPETGIDLSWSDKSDTDTDTWLPYRDERWLRWQYDDRDLNTYEMAEMVGVTPTTICRWMDRHDIPRDGPGGDAE